MAPVFSSPRECIEIPAGPLPTLLTSRPIVDSEAESCRGRRKPAALIEIPEEGGDACGGLRIKNTFYDTSEKRSPSLEDFYRERSVRTCPSASVGMLQGLFQEGGLPHTPDAAGMFEGPPVAKNFRENLEEKRRTVVSLADSLRLGSLEFVPAEAPANGMSVPALDMAPEAAYLNGGMGTYGALQAPVCAQLPCDYAFTVPSNRAPIACDYGFKQPAGEYTFGGQAMGAPMPCDYGFSAHGATQPCEYGFGGDGSMTTPGGAMSLQYTTPSQPPAYEPYSLVPSAPPVFPMSCGSEAAAAASVSIGTTPSMPSPPSRPALGSPEMPSMGSQGHGLGQCKPCAFLYTKGCENGIGCQFCHLCESGEKKRRRKAKLESQRTVRRERAAKA
mmetsp:Transcript_108822/g.150477  ORF Transcript_108822/g.150477 Transcript_108822/m.150477 type:complete len:388 (-) Transcript_108822:464-1627(-)